MEERKYFVALNTNPKIGPMRFKKLLFYFKNAKKAWEASDFEYKKAGLEPEAIKSLLKIKKEINPDKEMEKLERLKISVLTIKDKNYPKILKEIYDPPALLYLKGKIPQKEPFLAIVGSRACTFYGRQIAEELAYNLTSSGLIIVSGLALGIDSQAHKGALKAKGKTIAVLGNGLDQIYPYSHKKLAEEIIESGGAIISEFHPGVPPLKQNFPQRNRIISGLSRGVVVVEASERSGALITARHALEQNREVFAVPGNIKSPHSFGCNNLIKMGAYPVTEASDVLTELNIKPKIRKEKEIKPENKEEEILLSFLSHEPLHIDKLIELSKLDVALVNSTLILMEMKGMVKNIGGGNYIKG